MTVAVFETTPGALGSVRIVIVAVPAFAIVPSRQVTAPPACEHDPCVVVTERKVTAEGSVSLTVTLVADAGPLLETASVYVSGVPSVTGLGVAVFTIATSALLAFATTTVALAVLVVRPGGMLAALAVAVSVMLVPVGVRAFTCSTSEKFAVLPAPTPKEPPSVQVIVPVPPTAGGTQIHPAGAVTDWKFVFGGVLWVNVIPGVAAAGPLFVTVCV